VIRTRVLLAGKHELACALLDELADRPALEVVVVPSKSERENETGRQSLKRLVKERRVAALSDGADSPLLEPVRFFQPHVLISAGFDRIVRRDVLAMVPIPVNIHFGMLPRYRGNLSIPWAIMNSEREIGITLHYIAQGIDDGAIIAQRTIENDPALSCRSLYERAVPVGVDLTSECIEQILSGSKPDGTLQDETAATYFPPGFPLNFRVPFRQTGTFVLNYVRAAYFPPYEGAYAEIEGHRLEFLWHPSVAFASGSQDTKPGTVQLSGERWSISVLNGLFQPSRVKLDGVEMEFAEACVRSALEGKRIA
jgi:methionyl-tRNA formyltransferase